MKTLWYGCIALMLMGCGGSQGKKDASPSAAAGTDTAIINTVPNWSDPDSTIYGYSDGFGQSAFTLITKDGEEYDLALTATDEADPYGKIYGDREDSAQYALTTRDGEEAIGVLINLSQLNKFTTHYSIYNGHLILEEGGNRDWVEIRELNDTVFRAVGKSGKMYEYRR